MDRPGTTPVGRDSRATREDGALLELAQLPETTVTAFRETLKKAFPDMAPLERIRITAALGTAAHELVMRACAENSR